MNIRFMPRLLNLTPEAFHYCSHESPSPPRSDEVVPRSFYPLRLYLMIRPGKTRQDNRNEVQPRSNGGWGIQHAAIMQHLRCKTGQTAYKANIH